MLTMPVGTLNVLPAILESFMVVLPELHAPPVLLVLFMDHCTVAHHSAETVQLRISLAVQVAASAIRARGHHTASRACPPAEVALKDFIKDSQQVNVLLVLKDTLVTQRLRQGAQHAQQGPMHRLRAVQPVHRVPMARSNPSKAKPLAATAHWQLASIPIQQRERLLVQFVRLECSRILSAHNVVLPIVLKENR
jgi:hypothetical protein